MLQIGSQISKKLQNWTSKHCSCRRIRLDPSKTALRIRTLYATLGRGWPRSVHYTWYFGGSLQCYAYSVRIAKSSSDLSRIVVGTTFRFWRPPLKSQLRFTHYTRYIWAVRRDPYTIRVTLSKPSKTPRIVCQNSSHITQVLYIVCGSHVPFWRGFGLLMISIDVFFENHRFLNVFWTT